MILFVSLLLLLVLLLVVVELVTLDEDFLEREHDLGSLMPRLSTSSEISSLSSSFSVASESPELGLEMFWDSAKS